MEMGNVSSDSDQVAVLYDKISPLGKVRTAEWFKLQENKICSIELLNDPRIFVEAFSKQVRELGSRGITMPCSRPFFATSLQSFALNGRLK